MLLSNGLIIALLGAFAALLVALVVYLMIKLARGPRQAEVAITAELIAERVRAAGKLVGLEVCAKEIATAKKGWSWLPPLLLSPARLAMIFQFEKQYYVDLARVCPRDVSDFGNRRYQLILPPVEGVLRLTDVTPYDIQDGRILGLVDVIQMKAEAQGELMRRAQDQAALLFETADPRYLQEARRSIQKQLTALLALFDAEVDVIWKDALITPATAVIEQAPHAQPLLPAGTH